MITNKKIGELRFASYDCQLEKKLQLKICHLASRSGDPAFCRQRTGPRVCTHPGEEEKTKCLELCSSWLKGHFYPNNLHT